MKKMESEEEVFGIQAKKEYKNDYILALIEQTQVN